jgi:microcystin-dependent protein
MDITHIILFIQFIAIIYLIIKMSQISNKNDEKFEKFTTTSSNDIIQAVNNLYKVDIDAMRNLASISKRILTTPDELIIPASTTTANKFLVKGDMEVRGKVVFTNKNTNVMDIFPKFMVIAWASIDIPKGWALCDGKTYVLNVTTGIASEVLANSSGGTVTPDLRARFIVGAGTFEVNIADRDPYYNISTISTSLSTKATVNIDFGARDGESAHKLTENEMPRHSHFAFANDTVGVYGDITSTNCPARSTINGANSANYIMTSSGSTATVGKTSEVGGAGERHNNMPPYHALYYIMKL